MCVCLYKYCISLNIRNLCLTLENTDHIINLMNIALIVTFALRYSIKYARNFCFVKYSIILTYYACRGVGHALLVSLFRDQYMLC